MMKKPSPKQIKILLIVLAGLFVSLAIVFGLFGGRLWKKLSINQIRDISFELYRAQGLMSNGYGSFDDSVYAGIYADIFRRHNVRQEDYDSTVAWYVANKSEKLLIALQAVQDSLNNTANRQDSLYRLQGTLLASDAMASANADQDSINFFAPNTITFFPLGRDLFIRSFASPMSCGRTGRAHFRLAMRLWGLKSGAAVDAQITMSLSITQAGQRVSSKARIIRSNGLHLIDLPIPTEGSGYRVEALIFAPNSPHHQPDGYTYPFVAMDSLSLIRYD